MYNLIRFIRQNRYRITIIILFIIFIYSLIRVANNAYKDMAKEQTKNEEDVKLQTDGTVNLSDKNCEKIIEEFLSKCTNGDYEGAYIYISTKCKEEKYPTLDEFKINYCNNFMIEGKDYKIKKIQKYKYEIKLSDMLSSGNKNSRSITNYCNITVENGNEIKIEI